VVAPSLNVLTPQAAANLEAYVRAGGHLVLGPRSGMKTEDNALQSQRQPGPLADLLCARVEQFYALDQSVPIDGTWGSGTDTIWAEQLAAKSTDTQVLMRYGKINGWLDGKPAAVTRKVGKGSITYVGAMLDARTMANAAKWMVGKSGVTAIMPELPADVDLSIRTGAGRRVLIFTNYGVEPHTIDLPQRMKDVLQKGTVTKITLAQYGVAVLEDSR
jgi:beta-galactosidase